MVKDWVPVCQGVGVEVTELEMAPVFRDLHVAPEQSGRRRAKTRNRLK